MTPTIQLKPGKEKRVYTLHPWIFKSDIDKELNGSIAGDIVDIISSKGKFLARGYYNPNSQIALRIMTYNEEEAVDRDLIFRRIHEAVEYRRTFADLKSCRLVFAESDRLPALIVERGADQRSVTSGAKCLVQILRVIDALELWFLGFGCRLLSSSRLLRFTCHLFLLVVTVKMVVVEGV